MKYISQLLSISGGSIGLRNLVRMLFLNIYLLKGVRSFVIRGRGVGFTKDLLNFGIKLHGNIVLKMLSGYGIVTYRVKLLNWMENF